MLSIYADAIMTAARRGKWPAPDHWTTNRAPRSEAEHAYKEAQWRRHIYRDIGMR
jgi:hypothetical protein